MSDVLSITPSLSIEKDNNNEFWIETVDDRIPITKKQAIELAHWIIRQPNTKEALYDV